VLIITISIGFICEIFHIFSVTYSHSGGDLQNAGLIPLFNLCSVVFMAVSRNEGFQLQMTGGLCPVRYQLKEPKALKVSLAILRQHATVHKSTLYIMAGRSFKNPRFSELVRTGKTASAQFERRLIQERTKAGLSAARARGRKGGCKPIRSDDPRVQMAKRMYHNHGMSIDRICRTLKISRATFYRYITLSDKLINISPGTYVHFLSGCSSSPYTSYFP
jgi:helix-turn-helix resolvase-like protein/resolvase-like protein